MNRLWTVALLAVIALQGLVIAGLIKSPFATGPEGKRQEAKQAVKPSKAEAIPGSPLKRVTVSAKAAERLGIKTAPVTEQAVVRKQIFPGEVVSSAQPGATAAAPGVVRVVLADEIKRVAKEQPSMVMPLSSADGFANSTGAPIEKPEGVGPDGGGALFYKVEGAGQGLSSGKRVRVELMLEGNGKLRNTVPYSAVLYDSQGVSWVFTAPQPLTFVRERIKIDFIDGDLVVLTDGPAPGTLVVTEGASELFGAELYGK